LPLQYEVDGAGRDRSGQPPEYKRIADELWGSAPGERTVGKGKVFAGLTAADAVKSLKIEPDFEYTKPQADTLLLYVHRKLRDGDSYAPGGIRREAVGIDI
jgi:hypothetical protein